MASRGYSEQPDAAVGASTVTGGVGSVAKRPKILVLYYSEGNHLKTMADSVVRGLETVPDVQVETLQIPEDFSATDKGAQAGSDPQITPDTVYKVEEASGVVFGLPGLCGLPSAPVKRFFDELSRAASPGSLTGKPAGLFTSTSLPGSGQETTIWAMVAQLSAMGMVFVPTGYGFGPAMFDLKEVHGGSPFGAGTFSGTDNKREPTPHELQLAQYQGSYFGLVSKRFS
mmetsp:Transcript_5819/g.17399  ORF Transcript_5819/g.17399 Transcript_5819/m.17399 type:complete len:228 (-) Transcript_5819:78-761(-)